MSRSRPNPGKNKKIKHGFVSNSGRNAGKPQEAKPSNRSQRRKQNHGSEGGD